jgi:hypothetical protein
MGNKFPGTCYFCGKLVEPKQGHFERDHGKWKTIHAQCVFEQRKLKERQEQQEGQS